MPLRKHSPSAPEENEVHRPPYDQSHERGFHFGKLFIGILLIFLGLYFLAKNTGYLPEGFDFHFAKLWPLILIYFGLANLRMRGFMGAVFGILTTIVVVGLIGLFLLGAPKEEQQDESNETPIRAELEANAEAAVLRIKAGSGKIELQGGEIDALLEGSQHGANFIVTSELEKGIQSVLLEANNRNLPGYFWQNSHGQLELTANSALPWELFLEAGAANIDLDLRKIRTEKVDIQAGASDLDLRLGDLVEDAEVKIEGGVSSVKIVIPEEMAAEINLQGGLNSEDLSGFIEIGPNRYVTENYDLAVRRVHLDLNLGVSSLEIERE